MIYFELDAKTEFSIYIYIYIYFGCGLWGLVCGVFFLAGSGTIWGLRQGLIKSRLEMVCLLVDKLDS